MREKCLPLAVVLTMLFAVVGVGAHQHEGPMAKLPACCKKARSNEPGASMARVCCNLNCSEPGSTGNTASSSSSVQLSTTASAGVAPNVAPFNSKVVFTPHFQRLNSDDSNPKYIKHLALLI